MHMRIHTAINVMPGTCARHYIYCCVYCCVYAFVAAIVYCMCGIAGKAKVIKIVVCTKIFCQPFHKNVLHYVFK